VLDAHGKIAWGRSNIGGDLIVAVLTEQVSDARLAGLPSRLPKGGNPPVCDSPPTSAERLKPTHRGHSIQRGPTPHAWPG
jgi:hypothetical protein